MLAHKRYPLPASPCAVTTGVTSCGERASVRAGDDEIRSRPETPLMHPLAFAATAEDEQSGWALDATSTEDACGGYRAARLGASAPAQSTAATPRLQAMASGAFAHGVPSSVPMGMPSGLLGLFGAGGLLQRNGPIIRLVPSAAKAPCDDAGRNTLS